jgi:hypothetical protein
VQTKQRQASARVQPFQRSVVLERERDVGFGRDAALVGCVGGTGMSVDSGTFVTTAIIVVGDG